MNKFSTFLSVSQTLTQYIVIKCVGVLVCWCGLLKDRGEKQEWNGYRHYNISSCLFFLCALFLGHFNRALNERE